MPGLSAIVTDVFSSTTVFLLVASSIIPFVTGFISLPVLAILNLFTLLTVERFGSDCHPDRIHVRDFEVSNFSKFDSSRFLTLPIRFRVTLSKAMTRPWTEG